MAETQHSAEDFNEHVKTYDGFIRLTKWTIGIVVVVLILMAFFLL